MKKSNIAAKAEFNVDEVPAARISWPATTAELVISKRENRSKKPEKIFHLSPVEVNNQQQQPQQGPSRQPISTQPQPSPAPPILQPVGQQVQEVSEEEEDQLPPLPNLVLEPEENEVFVEDESEIEEMADEKDFRPAPFCGRAGEDGEEWMRHFLNYCSFKLMDDARRLALLKVLLAGNAAVWLDAQESSRTPTGEPLLTTFAQFREAFENRYKTPDILKYKSAKEIFSRRQGDDESCDNFIEAMRKLGRLIGAEEKMVTYAILSGLRPNIANYVTRQNPQNLEQLTEAARVAELTQGTDQFADVKPEIRRLSSKWDQLTAAPIAEKRTPSPKRVTFMQAPPQAPSPPSPRWQENYYPEDRKPPTHFTYPQSSFRGRGSRGGYRGGRNRSPEFGREMCPKCGKEPHANFLYCPANNKLCNFCHKRGHFSAVCRAARRGRDQRND